MNLVKGQGHRGNETKSGAIIEKKLDPVLESIIFELPDKKAVPIVSVGAEGVVGKGGSFSLLLCTMGLTLITQAILNRMLLLFMQPKVMDMDFLPELEFQEAF